MEENLIFKSENNFENKTNRNYFISTNENLVDVAFDFQGMHWTGNDREKNLKLRVTSHYGFRNVEPISREEKQKRSNFHKSKKTDIFFQFRKFIPNLPIKSTHFQVRKNFLMPVSNNPKISEIIYSKKFGIESYNIVTGKQQTLCMLSSEDESNFNKQMICFDVMKKDNGDYLICAGRADGSVSLYYVSREELERVREFKSNVVPKFENYLSKVISQGNSEEILTNYVKFINRGGTNLLMTTGNDGYIRFFDLDEDLKLANQFKAEAAINHCDFNCNMNIIGCVGDSTDVEIFDVRSNKREVKFYSHYDYGIVLKFRPGSDHVFATGNQDFSCSLWDLRKVFSENVNNTSNKMSSPIVYLSGYFESIGDLCFTNDGNPFLVFAENADYLHIYNLKNETIQTMTYCAYFSGLVYDNNTSQIYLGIEGQYNKSGILNYDIIRPKLSLDSEINII